jgi:hypothetical protein
LIRVGACTINKRLEHGVFALLNRLALGFLDEGDRAIRAVDVSVITLIYATVFKTTHREVHRLAVVEGSEISRVRGRVNGQRRPTWCEAVFTHVLQRRNDGKVRVACGAAAAIEESGVELIPVAHCQDGL